jgi:hypothetical protein
MQIRRLVVLFTFRVRILIRISDIEALLLDFSEKSKMMRECTFMQIIFVVIRLPTDCIYRTDLRNLKKLDFGRNYYKINLDKLVNSRYNK